MQRRSLPWPGFDPKRTVVEAVTLMSYAASLAEATVRWASMLAVFSKALSPQSFRSCAQLLSTSKVSMDISLG